MTDADKKAETKVAAKAKSTTKTKAAAKPKATTKASPEVKPKAKPETKPKAKPEAEKKSKAAPVDAAPYLTKPKQSATSQAESNKGKSSAPLVLLLAAVILIPVTVYKLDEQLNSQSTHSDPQENTEKSVPAIRSVQTTPVEPPANTEPAPVAIVQTDPVSNNTDSDQPIEIQAETKTEIQEEIKAEAATTTAATATQKTAAEHNETIDQRRQSYEEVMRSRQREYQAAMEARQQQIAKMTAERYGYYQRNRQNHEENRSKIQEIQQQIAALHEKINQLRQSSRVRR